MVRATSPLAGGCASSFAARVLVVVEEAHEYTSDDDDHCCRGHDDAGGCSDRGRLPEEPRHPTFDWVRLAFIRANGALLGGLASDHHRCQRLGAASSG